MASPARSPQPPPPRAVAAPNWWRSLLLLPFSVPLLIAESVWRALPTSARRERRFVLQMVGAHRTISVAEFERALAARRGTVIDETVTADGPWRIWWTPDDIAAQSPNPVARGPWATLVGHPEWQPFFAWCHARYLHPATGTALLVLCPPAEARKLYDRVHSGPHVTTYSYGCNG